MTLEPEKSILECLISGDVEPAINKLVRVSTLISAQLRDDWNLLRSSRLRTS